MVLIEVQKQEFAPHMVDTVEMRNQCFIKGLGHYVSKQLILFGHEPFDKVQNFNMKYEDKEQEFRVEKSKKSDDRSRDRNRHKPYDPNFIGRRLDNYPERN
ncbi:hypothetical protein FRX31_017922 [Thalictrum thalictroides]|uniref:Uncharacterized protein n=1 Tax=Thalictrum thalictroides TaxID=46969 RepID=A0A7J6W7I7_THATH|nr:hypothetical protein FRX31_017922 [Thalictrum thalictroides]